MHCGVSRKILCLGHPPCFLPAHRTSPHSTLQPILAVCLGPSGTISAVDLGTLPSPKFLPCPSPQDMLSQYFSFSTRPVCCAQYLSMGRQHLPCTSQPHSYCVLYKEGWHGAECVFKVCRGEKSCENKLTSVTVIFQPRQSPFFFPFFFFLLFLK